MDFGEALKRELVPLYRYALALARGRAPDAEDLVQDAVERALRYRDSFDPAKGALKPWLFAILTRAHAARAGGAARLVPTEPGDLDDRATPLPPPHYAVPDRVDVARALGDLDDLYRLPLLLHYFEGMGCAEVAEALSLTTSAVKVRLMRGRQSLARSPALAGEGR